MHTETLHPAVWLGLNSFCSASDVYALQQGDLGNAQTVSDYHNPDKQKRYVHMYAAKHIGIWRKLREITSLDSERPLVSIGAGPMLELIGWCWDKPWSGKKTAFDPLDWSAVRSNLFWKMAINSIGPVEYAPYRFVGRTNPIPQQLAQIAGLQPVDPIAEIPQRSIVFFPYVLNHLLGINAQMDAQQVDWFHNWIQRATHDRRATVVILDFKSDYANVWSALLATAGHAHLPPLTVNFCPSIKPLKSLYSSPNVVGRYRACGSPNMGKATVAIVDAQHGWRFVPPNLHLA